MTPPGEQPPSKPPPSPLLNVGESQAATLQLSKRKVRLAIALRNLFVFCFILFYFLSSLFTGAFRFSIFDFRRRLLNFCSLGKLTLFDFLFYFDFI